MRVLVLFTFVTGTVGFSYEKLLSNAGLKYRVAGEDYVQKNCNPDMPAIETWKNESYLRVILENERPSLPVYVGHNHSTTGHFIQDNYKNGPYHFFDRKPGEVAAAVPIEVHSINRLKNDIKKLPSFFPKTKTKHWFNGILWMSSGGETGLHTDKSDNNRVMQIVGQNQVLLFTEKNEHVLGNISNMAVALDADNLEDTRRKYPELWSTEPIVAVINPGDCLLIPDKRYHEVYHNGFTMTFGSWEKSPSVTPEDYIGCCDETPLAETLAKRFMRYQNNVSLDGIYQAMKEGRMNGDDIIENNLLEIFLEIWVDEGSYPYSFVIKDIMGMMVDTIYNQTNLDIYISGVGEL